MFIEHFVLFISVDKSNILDFKVQNKNESIKSERIS